MKQNKLIPELRFPEFEDNWQLIKVGEFAFFQRGFDLPERMRKIGEYPIVSSSGVSGFHSDYKVCPPGIVTGRYGSIGQIFYVERKFWPLNTSLWVKDFFQNDPKYTHYHLSTINFKRLSDKTGVPGINRNDLHKIKIKIPSLPEQQKIASFLTAVDKRIQLLKEKKEKLEAYKKGLMQQLFSAKWEEKDGQRTFIPPTLRFKQADGSDFPDWEEKKLGEIGDFKNGINKNSSDFGYGVPFVNLLDVFGKHKINIEKLNKVNASLSELSIYDLKEGDVLFIRSSVKREGVGETIVVEKDLSKTVYSGFLIRYRTNELLGLEYKKYCFWDPMFRKQLISMSTSSANTNINQQSLAKLTLGIPSVREQTVISRFLRLVNQRIAYLDMEILTSATFKKGLLQKMFV